MEGIAGFLTRLGIARVAAMVVTAVLLLGFFGFLMYRVSSPSLAPVYTGLNFDDSAAIVSELKSMNVPYEVRGDGEAILVPRDQITAIRMSLAESGLPTNGQVGYEIFDEQNTLGATSFVQNVNHVRALEGELARTISSLARVRSARVHLVLPERELFRREAAQPSASIVLDVRGGLSTGEIRSVQHLVAAAIEGLNPNAVSIVDTTGTLLASGTTDDGETMSTALTQERTQAVENRMRSQIEAILENVVGAGRARVQVAAELDMNRSTRTDETYDPDGQVVRSSQTRELVSSTAGPSATGAVSVANELPGAAGAGGTGGSPSEQSSTTEETVNYDISRTTMTQVTEAGTIKRLSVAVVVDGSYQDDGNGSAVWQPRSADEMAQISALVRSAMGFDQARGDQLEVANLQFASRPDLQLPASEPGLFDFTRDDIVSFAEMAVTLLIAVALVLFVLRPLIKRVMAPDEGPLTLPATSAQPEALPEGEHQAAGAKPAQSPEQEKQEADARDAWMEQASKMGEAQIQTVNRVGSMVEENPKQASMIVRDWLGEAA